MSDVSKTFQQFPEIHLGQGDDFKYVLHSYIA